MHRCKGCRCEGLKLWERERHFQLHKRQAERSERKRQETIHAQRVRNMAKARAARSG